MTFPRYDYLSPTDSLHPGIFFGASRFAPSAVTATVGISVMPIASNTARGLGVELPYA
jgi:hypothetical protein